MDKGLDNNKKIYFIDALMALFTALSLLLTMRVPVLNPVQSSDIVAEIFWNLKLSLAGKANQVLIALSMCLIRSLFCMVTPNNKACINYIIRKHRLRSHLGQLNAYLDFQKLSTCEGMSLNLDNTMNNKRLQIEKMR